MAIKKNKLYEKNNIEIKDCVTRLLFIARTNKTLLKIYPHLGLDPYKFTVSVEKNPAMTVLILNVNNPEYLNLSLCTAYAFSDDSIEVMLINWFSYAYAEKHATEEQKEYPLLLHQFAISSVLNSVRLHTINSQITLIATIDYVYNQYLGFSVFNSTSISELAGKDKFNTISNLLYTPNNLSDVEMKLFDKVYDTTLSLFGERVADAINKYEKSEGEVYGGIKKW